MKRMTASKKFVAVFTLVLTLIALLTAPTLFNSSVAAQGQETCPNSGDWVKVDGLSGQTYEYTAPEGKVVVETCYKAGTTVEYETINPPQSTVIIESMVQAELSHISVRLADESTSTPTSTPTLTPTPTFTPTPTPTDEPKQSPLTLESECAEAVTVTAIPGVLTWTVTNENDEAISFNWSANNGQSGSGVAPANGTTTFMTNGDGYIVELAYELDEAPVTTEAEANVCEFEEEAKDLQLLGECLGEGVSEWTVVNNNDSSISFSWVANNGAEGEGEVPAKSEVSFQVTGEADAVSISYTLNEETVIVDTAIEVCEQEQPKEEEEKDVDPSPDIAAGGNGPSLINSALPLLVGFSGLGLASALIIKRKQIFVNNK